MKGENIMRPRKFNKGDIALHCNETVQISSIDTNRSAESQSGAVYYRIRKPGSTRSHASIRSDYLKKTSKR